MDNGEWVKSRAKAQFERTAASYVTSTGHAQGQDLQTLVDWLAPQSVWTALDIATGGGHVAKVLAPSVGHVVATDLTPKMLQAARDNLLGCGLCNVTYVIADAESLPFLDGSFDAVTCRIAPHHFPNPDRFIDEVSRVLKPGGKFLLIDNVAPDAPALADYLNTFERMRDDSHVRCLPISEWTRLLQTAGLGVLSARARKKQMSFRPWIERMAQSAEHVAQVEQFMLDGPEAARSYFDIHVNQHRIESVSVDEWMVMCEKPRTV